MNINMLCDGLLCPRGRWSSRVRALLEMVMMFRLLLACFGLVYAWGFVALCLVGTEYEMW